ncbi:hypothetical protein MTX78_03700 [Hymenobacter tibetensis]|uniref:Uncharacterized protein n=1 Tax=Hymenobacter tibetensis TaxID=497967 RepID=A0ABY4D3C2_9BACT|nr:hypothetical protein [Hymenobacter tibetensis]UOG75704.1 hypothetical protein MTX78_03700 [Hymenobacter tibetensis]
MRSFHTMKLALQSCLLLLLLASTSLRAQVGVGTTTPDAKAALDIQAADKGLLIPRLTAAQRLAIASPPQGLMVYQTDGTTSGGAQTGFWYYAGAPAQWVFLNPTSGNSGLVLPYTGTVAVEASAFSITNTAFDSEALSGTTTNDDAAGVVGRNTNTTSTQGIGVKGTSRGGTGVSGTAFTSGVGVAGESVGGTGLWGTSTTGVAVKGAKPNGSTVRGRVAEFTNASAANDSTAAYISTNGDRPALRAVNTAASGQAAIRGVKQAAAVDGIGVEGVITSGASGNAAGVLGHDKSGSGTGSGVVGLTAGGYGVRGIASGNGGFGVSGSSTDSYGVIGGSQTGSGVYGTTTAGAAAIAGVKGNSSHPSGIGVLGTTTNGYAVRGEATGNDGYGVTGTAIRGYGVIGTSNLGSGVYGVTSGAIAGTAGVQGAGLNSGGIGVLGTTTSGAGVRGEATGSGGYGIVGTASSTNGIAVVGQSGGSATALYGLATGTGRAGYFGQNNASSSAAAVEIGQSGTGPALLFSTGTRPAEINSSATGTANLVPIAYGRVAPNGAVLSGTGNFTVVQNVTGLGSYTITLTNVGGADLTNAICQVTPRFGTSAKPNQTFAASANGRASGRIDVHISDLTGANNLEEQGFSFIVYRP